MNLPTGLAAGAHRPRWQRYAAAALASALCTLVAALMFPYFELTNLVMVYLLGTTIVALRLGRGPASVSAIVNVAAFDFFFVRPRFTMAVADVQYLLTFAVMLIVALTIATLVASVRAQTELVAARERRTALLYAMSRELAATRSLEDLVRVAARHVAETFGCEAEVLLPDAADARGVVAAAMPTASVQSLPLNGAARGLGVLAVRMAPPGRVLPPGQQQLLEAFAGQIALAIERALLAEEAERARVMAEKENLRNTLLGSISHDLRTPLAVIAGASSALSDPAIELDAATRARLAESIEVKAREMSELISNVLDLMRFESGEVKLRRDWQTVDDLLGMALGRVGDALHDHPVEVALPADLPAVHVDAPLITQVLCNLLENGAKHTPPGTRMWVTAEVEPRAVRVIVDDDGPGLAAGDASRLFDKFHRSHDEGNTGGAGLGLAICRAIIAAHGGEITAANRAAGGARFAFTLDTVGPPL